MSKFFKCGMFPSGAFFEVEDRFQDQRHCSDLYDTVFWQDLCLKDNWKRLELKKIIEDEGFLSQKLDGYQITDPRHQIIPGLTRSEIEAGEMLTFSMEKSSSPHHSPPPPRGHQGGAPPPEGTQLAPSTLKQNSLVPLCQSSLSQFIVYKRKKTDFFAD